MVSASALFGLLGKIFEPFVKLFMKRYNQPKLYMAVVFKQRYVLEKSEYVNPPSDYTAYREYEVTVRNNSEHTAYRLFVRPPKDIHVHSVDPRWDYHKPFLIHGEYVFRHVLRKPVYGSLEDAETESKKWSPASFRIEYENVDGKDFYTEFRFGNPMQTQNQFGSFKSSAKK